MEKKGIKIAAQNRKAFHDYFVEDRYEAGVELFGTEVKSIRAGTLNLKDSYCQAKDGEVFAYGVHISTNLIAGRTLEQFDEKIIRSAKILHIRVGFSFIIYRAPAAAPQGCDTHDVRR